MPDLKGLYQEVILDHSKKPRNYRVLEGADHHAEGYNPLCGDRVTVYVKVENGRISDLSFQGSGCAISTSSASLLTEALKGKTIEEADALFEKFHALVTGEANGNLAEGASLGKLAVFSGVAEFPVRVKCATLAWHTLRSALKGEEKTVTTE
ncbi:MAG TPA: SUF system NifU family Fe-S cluster assembly protein [Terriglobia bacterium]|nr:SUF system NifU family Fe-S cluster assembly protein [Terriglobia bacterium]